MDSIIPNTTTSTTNFNQWNTPVLIKTIETNDTIELIYKQSSSISYTHDYDFMDIENERVFKIIFSCKKGKWDKSKPIYGRIIHPTGETYDFD